jgi:hypothetical protein
MLEPPSDLLEQAAFQGFQKNRKQSVEKEREE